MIEVAIAGRPNVGKSTLFNRLIGRPAAIVHGTSGTTRDAKRYTIAESDDVRYILMDTAGLEESGGKSMAGRMTSHALLAIKEAQIILFVADAKASITPEDAHFADMVKKYGRKVILVANKSENRRDFDASVGDFFTLGFGEAIPVSAEHGLGIPALKDAIRRAVVEAMAKERNGALLSDEEVREIIGIEDGSADEEPDTSVRIAIVGRPNAGKSTLVNALLGLERMLTGVEAGTTRDAVDTDFVWRGRAVRLIDTAGMRKKSKVAEELEGLSTGRAIEAVKNSDVALVVVDAERGLDAQDIAIAGVAEREGKGVAVAINKGDLVKNKKEILNKARERLASSFAQVKDVPAVFVSAMRRTGIAELMAAAFELYDLRRQRITTGRLNKWLEHAVGRNPPPMSRLKRPTNIKYITQSAVKPPTFVLFAGGGAKLPEPYKRYLLNSLGDEFGFKKIPLRLKVKSSDNPYGKEKDK